MVSIWGLNYPMGTVRIRDLALNKHKRRTMILDREQVKIMKATAIMKTFRGMNYWVRPTSNKKGE